MSDQNRRVLHRGAERFLLVPRGSRAVGARVQFTDRESARAFLAQLATDAGNREVLRAAAKETMGGVASGFGGRPDEQEWAPLTEGLARGSVELVRFIDHPIAPCEVRTTGELTLSEVSWGETSGLYPTHDHLYRPDRWDQAKMCELLRARAAVHDVATRNHDVRKAKPSLGHIDQMMVPYHAIENFPRKDAVIDEHVKWFYLSSYADRPISHPGTSNTVIVKSYGPFYNIGGGDVDHGDCYLHFYRLADTASGHGR
jgi:hypothetical protein